MKILILNPHIDATHEITRALQSKGHAVLLTIHPDEAWQVFQLHASTVDLIILHREITAATTGLQFLDQLKAASPDTASIVTSEEWGEDDFAKHQATSSGAHAYVRSPFNAELLLSVIEQMFSPEVQAQAQVPTHPSVPSMSLETSGASGLVLEESSALYPDQTPLSASSIVLESPVDELSLSGAQTDSETNPCIGLELSAAPIQIASVEPTSPTIEELITPAPAPFFEMASEAEVQKVPTSASADDPQAAREMPYLFGKAWGQTPASSISFAQAVGDAVIPGGAAHTPDVDTLKKYLMLREQDVAVLSTQLKTLKDQLGQREKDLNDQHAANTELTHQIMECGVRIEELEREKSLALVALEKELGEVKFQNKAKIDRARVLEKQVRDAASEIEKLKDRVRTDIRKIRVREKELENRLEIMKKDSEALIGARETKIIELKRKLDLLEFNMDLLQDQYVREKESSAKMRQLLAKAAQVVRVAGGLLDASDPSSSVGSVGDEIAHELESDEKVSTEKAS